jgi:major type 1 subunit fimbrin (pilin)
MNRSKAGFLQASAKSTKRRWNARGVWQRSVKSIATVLVGLACMSDASADLVCQSTDISSIPVGAIRVSPSTPVGTTLWTWSGQLKSVCGVKMTGGMRSENAWLYVPVINLGNGLALRVEYKGKDNSKTALSVDTGITVSQVWVSSVLSNQAVNADGVVIKIVKTAQTPTSGTLSTDTKAFANIGVQGDQYNGAQFSVTSLRKIGFVGSTCTVTTPSVNVDLGQVKLDNKAGFGSAQGSTSAAKDFLVNLNCDTGASGSYGVYMQLAATASSGLASSGVFSLGAGSTATGLGIQLLRGSGTSRTPVKFDTPWQIGTFPMTDANLSVPLSARYYQTGATISPGTANGTATFTITYQ